MKRGFKAEAERISIGYRAELGLEVNDPLCAFILANHLGIIILTPSQLGLNRYEQDKLMGSKSNNVGWSALTIRNKQNTHVIIHNNKHSEVRQQSDLMHELAHIICNHKLPIPDMNNIPFYMRVYNQDQENEANYLGSCLQIPRDALIWAIGEKRMKVKSIASYFNASTQMVNFRINITGVRKQFKFY